MQGGLDVLLTTSEASFNSLHTLYCFSSHIAAVTEQSMEDPEELQSSQQETVHDWLESIDKLPAVPPSLTQSKYTRLFAVDVAGFQEHDQYVYLVPNGLCIVGLAPSHILLRGSHAQQQTGTQPDGQMQLDAAQAASTQPISTGAAPAQAGTQGATEYAADMHNSEAPASTVAAASQHASTVGQKRKADALAATDASAAKDEQQPQEPSTGASEHGHANQGEGTAIDAIDCSPSKRRTTTSTSAMDPGVQKQPATKVAGAAPSMQLQVSFDIGSRNASIKQSGKKRNQGSILDAKSTLCVIEVTGKPSIKVQCVASGKLMEVNQRLKAQPQLLLTRPCREGYLGILFPTDRQLAALRQSLMPAEQYLQLRGLSEEDIA